MAMTTTETQGVPTDIKALSETSPVWPPVRRGRQGRAIVANQVST